MRIGSVNNVNFSPNFGDALSSKQEREYKHFLNEVEREQSYENGINIVKFYVPSLPSSKFEDTGIGKINSKEAERAYELANVYYNATGVKFMPMGPLTDRGVYTDDHYVGAYNRGALSVGEDAINISALTGKKYGNILSKKDAVAVVLKHTSNHDNTNIIDFETTLGWKNQEDYPINRTLKIAFQNFKNPENQSPELQALREEFEAFKNQKEPVDYDDVYTRLALFPYMKDPGTAKVDFFRGFDSDPNIRAQKMPEYERLKEQHKDAIEFYKFKQFLGHKAIADGKEIVNSKGMDAYGDCIIGFSWPEKQMFPDAFLDDAEVGWGLPAINFYDLINKDDSAAHKLLRTKVAHYLTNYDGIRFDVGWQYMNPCLIKNNGTSYEHLDAGNKITDFIEQIATEIKGPDFDQRKLMYECDANYSDFPIQEWHTKQKIKHLKGLAVLSTVEEHDKNVNGQVGWAHTAYLRENLGFHDDDAIVGTNNHDKDGVLNCSKDRHKSNEHVDALMRVFRLRPQDGKVDGWKLVKDDDNLLSHIQKYCRARFAEVKTMKNTFIQFFDMIGRSEKTDYHTGGVGENSHVDYKHRLERNYEENFHRALQDGVGYNAADVHKFRMEHDGTKERRPDLYEKAVKYAAYLQHKGNIYTREQADNSNRANLSIEDMTLEEIQKM